MLLPPSCSRMVPVLLATLAACVLCGKQVILYSRETVTQRVMILHRRETKEDSSSPEGSVPSIHRYLLSIEDMEVYLVVVLSQYHHEQT